LGAAVAVAVVVVKLEDPFDAFSGKLRLEPSGVGEVHEIIRLGSVQGVIGISLRFSVPHEKDEIGQTGTKIPGVLEIIVIFFRLFSSSFFEDNGE
jgi:hypothetical protein